MERAHLAETPTAKGTNATRPGLAGARALAVFGLCTGLGLAADLVSKHLAFARIGPYRVVTVIPGMFNLINSENEGAAFGVLGGAFAFFVVVSVAALGLLAYFSFTAKRSGIGYQLVLGLVASGVLGNLHDRLRFGAVRDFLDVHVSYGPAREWLVAHAGTNHWPTFNVADACICVGTGLLLVKFWRDERAEARSRASEHAAA